MKQTNKESQTINCTVTSCKYNNMPTGTFYDLPLQFFSNIVAYSPFYYNGTP